jgi:hypothetical protein
MANGWYIRTNETIDQAGYRFDEEDGKTYKVPRYVLNTDRFSNGVYQTVVFASYAKRVFINGVESETECT